MSTTFAVEVRKLIHTTPFGTSSADPVLRRRLELPFAPFIGLELYDNDGDWEAILKEVSWDCQTQMFTCYTDANDEIKHAVRSRQNHRSVAEVVADYVECGWGVVQP